MPDPPRLRQPSHSGDGERVSIVDQEPEPEVLAQRRFDRPQIRKSTLTGMGAVSGETMPTLPAPNPLQRQTIRRPTPPSAVALARRTDPPTPDESTEPTSAAVALPIASLPPPSQSPEAASVEALRRRAEAAEARRDELERRERVRAESNSSAWPPRVAPSRVPPPERVTAVPDGAASDGSRRALRGAMTKLLLGLVALLALLGIPLTAYIQALTTQIERSTNQAAQANAAAADAKDGNSKAKQEAAASKSELAAFKAYFREVMRLQGVEIAKSKDDPEAGDLKPVVPFCSPGKVCPGAQLIITVPP